MDRKDNMGFLKNLFGGTSAKPEKRYYTFNVKCNRCGEIIEGRVDLDNDLSLEYEGDQRLLFCPQRIDRKQQMFSANRSGNEIHIRA